MPRAAINNVKLQELESLSKRDLHQLADDLVLKETGAVEKCVEFVLAETEGLWHGRARAMMCRRLKHCEITAEQRRQLVACITERLALGNFSEQFYDQLRLAMYLDQKRVEVAHKCLSGVPKDHVRRFAIWILKH